MSMSRWGGKPPLVLIVDDQEPNLRLLGRVLGEAEFDVMPADSGERALERLQAALPDVILLDMRMPGMGGFAVLEALKAEPAWADLPVVFLTAAHERELLIKAFSNGAVDYITKPFVAEELIARVSTHAELKRSRDQLRRAIKEREDIATIIVHDLKNPLFNICLNAEMVRGESEKDSSIWQYARSIENSARKAMDFVERYLQRRADVELRSGYRPSAQSAYELMSAAIEEFAEEARRNQQRIELGCPQSLRVSCDRESTASILRNLLSNALKYSPADSEVEVGAAVANDGSTRLWVADRGPGVSASDKAKLFQRYVRLGAKEQQAAKSSGVGLAMARQEAEWMGGELWHEDRSGGGSVFTLKLPVMSAGAEIKQDADQDSAT